MLIRIAVVLTLTGCGRTGLVDGLEVGLTLPGSPPVIDHAESTCTAPDAGAPFVEHSWTWREPCIDVEYVPELQSELPLLRAALAAWAPSCTWLCFNEPRLFSNTPAEHRFIVHQDNGTLSPADGAIGVGVEVQAPTAPPRHAALVRRRVVSATGEDYLAAVGRALGFVPSGLESAVSGSLSALTPADERSVCKAYPCK